MYTSQLKHSLSNIPVATRLLTLSIIIISTLGFLLSFPAASNQGDNVVVDASAGGRLIPLLAMVPGSSIFYMWTFVTAGFLETSLLPLLIDGFGFVMMARYMEHAWGLREFVMFVGIVNVSAYFGAFVMALIEYAGSLDPTYFYETQVCGLGGILCGFVVAYKQMVPEHTVTLFKFFSIRVKQLPSLVIIGHLILVLFRLEGNLQFWVALYGSLSAWVYIRFYKVQDGIRGDRSETFSIASFFPEVLHPIIKPTSNSSFNLLVKLKICPPLVGTASEGHMDLETGKSRASMSGPSATVEAERRRALALKALDERAAARAQQNVIPPIMSSTSIASSIGGRPSLSPSLKPQAPPIAKSNSSASSSPTGPKVSSPSSLKTND
ncbi:hypothetical protein SeMB42_g06345 [Synchytrium endobioticum]|uniref:Peptidase S54 rhomboid domain-containing protein n=1 Tax=Synchytrium endobioticum TaxID=286115 RepID=A0A507CDN0_9FUNG|nr:hypothetical protein SeMB42_g06345 [Synchytrium endobioticum]TPX39620.1 hypothetical protein SeLEV6574_g07098 [Synchytrium endobioticum]